MAERALIDETYEEIATDSPRNGLNFPKDSKWAWIVCCCSFLTQVFILGVLHAFGVFFVEFVEEFKTSKGTAAWVGSVAYGLSMAVGPFVSMLVNRFGHRRVMMLGGSMCAVSLLTSSFATSISVLFLTFTVLYGVGAGLAITPTMTVGQEYFDKYASVSVGIMTAGSSIGTLINAPLSQALIRAIGWRNTFRVFTGTCTLTIVFMSQIRPISVRQKTPSQKIQTSPARRLMEELKLWKSRVFIVWTAAITCVMFGYYIPYVHLVSYAVDNGITQEQGSILVMMLGGVTATGRVLFGKVVQYGFLNRLHMHQLSMVITGAGTMMLPLITSFGGLAVYVIIVGLVDGCYVVLLPLLTCSLVGSEQAVLAWGFLTGACSLTFTLGPPVAGLMYDEFGSYNVAFHVAAIPVLVGALILFLIPWAQRTSSSSSIIKVISAAQLHEGDELSTVDFITLSKCSSLADPRPSPSRESDAISNTDIDVNGLYFSDINQDTVIPRSAGGRRGLREVDFALSALQKSDQVLSKMLGAGKRNSPVGRPEIPLQYEASRSPTASAGKGSFRKSNVINISSSTKSPGNRRSPYLARTGDSERSRGNVGVQADLVSVDSRISSQQSGVCSRASVNHFNPTASALFQAILALEQQQQQQQTGSNPLSESSRASAVSAIQPTTPLLEEFVGAQLERLIDSLRSLSCHHSPGVQILSGEMQEPRSGVSMSSHGADSRGSSHRVPSCHTRTASTQTRPDDIEDDRAHVNSSVQSPQLQGCNVPEQSDTPSTGNLPDGLRIGTGSTPVDIPSMPSQVEDLEVFSMDPLSPFGSPPSDIPRIPPPPPPPCQHPEPVHRGNTFPIPVQTAACPTTPVEGGGIFPMDPSPGEEILLTESPPSSSTGAFPTAPGTLQPKETLSSKTLSSSDGIFKMDEDHFGYTPKLQSCVETSDDVGESSLSALTSDASGGNSQTMQTGRFTVDVVNWPDDNTQSPPPLSANTRINHPASDQDLMSMATLGELSTREPQDLHLESFEEQTTQRSGAFDVNLTASDEQKGADDSESVTVVYHDDVMFSLDPLNEGTLDDNETYENQDTQGQSRSGGFIAIQK